MIFFARGEIGLGEITHCIHIYILMFSVGGGREEGGKECVGE